MKNTLLDFFDFLSGWHNEGDDFDPTPPDPSESEISPIDREDFFDNWQASLDEDR